MIAHKCFICNWKDNCFEKKYFTYSAFEDIDIKDRNTEINFGLSEEGNNEIEAVTFVDILIKYVPNSIGIKFKNLVALEFKRSGLKEINKENLKTMPSLKHLWLWYNKLEELPHDLFTYAPQIEIINFKGNSISKIGKHILKPLNNLMFADFRGNPKINRMYKVKNATNTLELLNEDIEKCCRSEPKESSTVSSYVKEMWETKCLSDFTIIVGEKSFKVHKNILAVNSCVFRSMFNHTNFNENITNEMEVVDITAEAFEEFLDFIYNRTIPEKATNAMDLYAVAAKYQVEELIKISEEFIFDMIDENNAWSVFTLGKIYGNDFMKILAFKKMSKLFPDHKLSDDLLNESSRKKIKKLVSLERN
ncbi:CLUMA_CG019571, isoform A [Clunio marinus]|uniref:CLUMA_CG019571, isoform A n=1 Tax=Clunio marinus TaxID=568069 RepID=A0A1J1J3U7_9DIPT|nr:CLUMA_CG019571, isoform A [Clunio marinus]